MALTLNFFHKMILKSILISLINLLIVTKIYGIRKEVKLNSFDCGISTQKFIVGGIEAKENEFPFMASIQLKLKKHPFSAHFCGGSLISSRYILTAAHCVDPLIKAGMKPSNISVVIGTIDKRKGVTNVFQSLLNINNTLDQKFSYEVNQWIINGCFNTKDILSDDIALIRLAEDIEINKKSIGTICLPPKYAEPISTKITVTGWGVWSETSNSEEESTPDIMQKTFTNIVSEEFCETYTYFRSVGLTGNHDLGTRICLMKADNTICRGDSGGPAFQLVNNRIYQLGIASFISVGPMSNKCSKSTPTFYLKVSYYFDWISKVIDKYQSSDIAVVSTEC